MKSIYTREQKERITELFNQGLTLTKISVATGIDVSKLKALTQRMGLRRNCRKVWTEEEDKRLAELYPTSLLPELLLEFKCPRHVIYNRAYALGIKKDKSVLTKYGKILQKHGKCTRFKKGNSPANKGKKMTPEAYEKAKHTFFKKGSKPANTYKEGNGHLSVRSATEKFQGYVYLKISDSNWVEYHRWLWKKHFGKIPKRHVVTFRDGNTLNCTLDNLELITMAENAKRNSGSINLPDGYVAKLMARNGRQVDNELAEQLQQHPELIELKRNQLKLERHVRSSNKSD